MCNVYVLCSRDSEFYIEIIGKWYRIIGTFLSIIGTNLTVNIGSVTGNAILCGYN